MPYEKGGRVGCDLGFQVFEGRFVLHLWCLHETGNSVSAGNACAVSTERLFAVYISAENEDVNTSKEAPLLSINVG